MYSLGLGKGAQYWIICRKECFSWVSAVFSLFYVVLIGGLVAGCRGFSGVEAICIKMQADLHIYICF